MEGIFFEITIIIIISAALSIVFRLIKQPPILAYILTGIIIGRVGFLPLHSKDVLQSLAELGITLLLFMLGLEIKLSELPSIGKVATIIGALQVITSAVIGYGIAVIFGFSQLTSFYLALAVTFSSTIIVVKLLSDKKDLHSLYGKISVGILLVQDVIAIFLLIFLNGFTSSGLTNGGIILNTILLLYKGLVLLAIILYLSQKILPKILDSIAHSSETLFLFSLAWVFGVAAFVSSPYIGFSIEIGGFLAGLAMSNSMENYQIASRMRTLRDFFVILFFVLLGLQMNFSNITSVIVPALAFSLFVLFGKPLITMIFMGVLGYRRRTSFLTSINLAQISEFSLILVFLGYRLKHINANTISLITLIGIITFTVSTYLILYGNKIHHTLRTWLGVFERKGYHAEDIEDVGELENHVVLIGARRVGENILQALVAKKENLLVVDFDPDIVRKLKENDIKTLFGDIADFDIQEGAQIEKARLVISTVPDIEDNLILIKSLNKINHKAKIIVLAEDIHEEKILYKAGADYVVIPHFAGGHHIARAISENKLEKLDRKSEQSHSFVN